MLVGVDLVQVSQIAKSVAQLGDAYTSRIWRPQEVEFFNTLPAIAPARFASSFAAKGAAIKALRLADTGLDLRTIEVRQADGWWEIELHGRAAELAEAAGWQSWSLSLSQEGDYAIATVAVLAEGVRSI